MVVGNYDGAADVYESLEKNVPGLVMVSMRRINLERRIGSPESVEVLYRHKIEHAGTGQEKSFYIIKFARYLAKVCKKKFEFVSIISMSNRPHIFH